MLSRKLIAVAASLWPALVVAAELPSPASAVAAALEDAGRLPPQVALRTRYLWQPDDAATVKARPPRPSSTRRSTC